MATVDPVIFPIAGYGIDRGWIMTSAGFTFLMQIGLGLMEIGSIRRKNSRIVWYKILLNLIFCAWWWYLLGYSWGFGEVNGSFVGAQDYYAGDNWGAPLNQGFNSLPEVEDELNGPGYPTQYAHYVWIVSIALVATTIATGILTERITMRAVVVFNIAMNLIILPFVFAWTFGFGFLVDDIGYRDFAGSFIIFGTGAFAGLAGLIFIKPRYNRYQKFPVVLLGGPAGVPLVGDRPASASDVASRNLPSSAFDKVKQDAAAYGPTTSAPPVGGLGAPHGSSTAFNIDNVVRVRARLNEDVYEHFGVTDFGLVCLGALITFIGFLFLIAGNSQGLQTALLGLFAEQAFSVALLGAMGGGLFTSLFLAIFVRRRPIRENYATVARAVIAGMVAVCADAGVYEPYQGVVIGILGAISYLIMAYVFFRVRFDDPAEFFPMFGGPAICGLICSAFFNHINGIFYDNGTEGEILIWQILSMAIIVGWTFFIAFICFWLLKVTHSLRIGLKTEIIGYDYIDGGRHLDYPDKAIDDLMKEQKRVN